MIVDSVGSVAVQLAAGACDSAQPAINETVKDLLVLVHVQRIRTRCPGEQTLASPGHASCAIRQHPGARRHVAQQHHPRLAGQNGMLDDVIKHEMAHLLGFGTVWDLDNLVRDTTTKEPWFSGPDAQAAFQGAAELHGQGRAGRGRRRRGHHAEPLAGIGDDERADDRVPRPRPQSAQRDHDRVDGGPGLRGEHGAADPWPTGEAEPARPSPQCRRLPCPAQDRPPTPCSSGRASG